MTSTSYLEEFKKDVQKIYDELKNDNQGDIATYIPQLAKVNDELFGISITMLDGEQINIGDTDEHYCIQSCSKPLTYALALENMGVDKVNKHIGVEPSGQSFNAFVFNDENIPFNALINSGAIAAASLIQPTETEDKRFEYMITKWKSIIGKNNVGFDNGVYLSEKRTANRNRALSHVMMENNVFMENTDIEKTLELYFQLCSLTMDAQGMSKFAAMLANGGVSIDTKERILSSNVVKSLLCVMYSAGMYDYSGRWAYNVGLPAKSGVSGCIFAVVPKLCGICVYSPKLDKIGNSYRGVQFFERITSMYRLHIFDTLIDGLDKKKQFMPSPVDTISQLCQACGDNNKELVAKILEENGVDVNKGDYDGRRALHIATDDKHYDCVELLVKHGADCNVKDRWGKSPIDKARELNDDTLLKLFEVSDDKSTD